MNKNFDLAVVGYVPALQYMANEPSYGPECPPNKMEVHKITHSETGISTLAMVFNPDKMSPSFKQDLIFEKVLIDRPKTIADRINDLHIIDPTTKVHQSIHDYEREKPQKHRWQEVVSRDPKRKKVKAARKAARASKRKRKIKKSKK